MENNGGINNGKEVQFVNGEQAKIKKNGKKDDEGDKKEELQPISFFRLYKYATGTDKILITIGLLSATITGLCTPANTFIFGRLIDAMVEQGRATANAYTSPSPEINSTDIRQMEIDFTWFLDEVQFFAIFNTIIGAIMLVFSYISTASFNYAAHNQIFRIRSAFVKSVLNQDMSWYDVNKSGEFASRINEDLTKFEEGLGEKVVMWTMFMVAFLGSIILAFVKGWLLALICLISLPVTLLSVGIVGVVTSRLAKQEMEAYAKAGGIAEEVFGAIRTVVAFSGQSMESDRYTEKLVEAKKINIKKGFFMGLGFGLLWFFIYASYALAFWYGVTLVLEQQGWDEEDIVYTVGVMFTVFFSIMMAGMNLGMSSPYIESFSMAKGAGAKIYSIIENQPTIDPLAGKGTRPDRALGNVSFRNVAFNYPSRKEVNVLQGINLAVSRGETVALVGPSGCGKSTVIQLIQRFYDPDHGEVYLDGINIKTLDVNWLRSRIGVVGQEPVLFGTTIYENIRYGDENATKEQIEEAAKAANAHNFIKQLPDGYHTLVGERGAQMSGGQKQRIAIARALVRNPDILLLDEATSALDTASEAKVQVALERASEGRTTIIVAHRLSTIRNADRIIVLKDGKVVENGNHTDLMKLHGEYFALVTAQTGSEIRDGKLERQEATIETFDEEEQTVDFLPDIDEDDFMKARTDMSIWQIMKWNKTEWVYIVIGSVSSLVMGAAMPLFAIIFGEILGVLSIEDPDVVRSETNRYSLYFVITGLAVGFATFLQIYTFSYAGEYLTERLRGWAFRAMLRQEVGWFDDKSNGTGALCSKLSTDAAAVQGATGQRIGTVLQAISTLMIAIGISMYYEWRLGLLALAFTPFLLVATYLEMKIMEQQNMGNAKALEKSTKLAVEFVSNIRTVVSLGREKMFHQKYIDHLEPAVKIAKRNTHYRGLVYGLSRSLMFFAFAACMVYGGHLVVHYDVNYANVFVVTQALIMGTVSIAGAFAYAPNFQKGFIAASKMNYLFERQPQIRDPQDVVEKPWNAYGSVNYYKTEFFYPSRPSSKVLQGLTMDAMQGQTIALVGPSGCGKSTCIQLLERFYDATDGFVAIDDKDVTSVTLKNLRAQMGIVSQEPSLFDRTIGQNIAYGDNSREISDAEIIEAAKKANIHNFITSLPLGYDTRLGDKGTQLSGGQKQRVAIARALIRNPRILLLDEATSALDTESEKVVQDALDVAREGRTCITIAHRLTTIVDSDVIYVINGGKVIEKGNHKELLELKGLYHGLYTLQAVAS